MTFVCIDISDVIKYISDRIANYDKPESMTEWCKKVIKELPFCKFQSLTCMRARLTRALRKIENLIEYSLMEKLQLVFIFSRPVSDRFVQILKDEKFEITQDDKKRIRRFSTEDGRVVKFSDHRQVYDEPRQINVNRKKAKKIDHGKQQGENKNVPIELNGENMDTGIKQQKMQKPNQDQQSKDEFGDIGGGANHGTFNARMNYVELGKQEWINPGLGTFIRVHKFNQKTFEFEYSQCETRESRRGIGKSNSRYVVGLFYNISQSEYFESWTF